MNAQERTHLENDIVEQLNVHYVKFAKSKINLMFFMKRELIISSLNSLRIDDLLCFPPF